MRLPLSRISGSTSLCQCISRWSASRSSMSARSPASASAHTPLRNARSAVHTAKSAAAASPRAIRDQTWPVAGSTLSISSSTSGANAPSMKWLYRFIYRLSEDRSGIVGLSAACGRPVFRAFYHNIYECELQISIIHVIRQFSGTENEMAATRAKAGIDRIRPHMIANADHAAFPAAILLNSNESAYGPSPQAAAAARAAITGLERYLDNPDHTLAPAI